MYVDTLQILQDEGYKRFGLDTVKISISRNHSASEESKILKTVKLKMLEHSYGYTFNGIVYYFNKTITHNITEGIFISYRI